MSDIFISYASQDRAVAQKLADALAGEGWPVWWDRTIMPGKSFAGGTHVRSTGEIGRVRVGKIEKKGRLNRRVNLILKG